MSGSLAVLVLAAGKGTRTKLSAPKVLLPLCGRTLLASVLDAVGGLAPDRTLVVVNHDKDGVSESLSGSAGEKSLEFVDQGRAQGTGHAVRVNRSISMRSLFIRPDAAPRLPRACRVVTVSPLLRALILRAMAVAPYYDEAGPDGRIMRVILDELRTLPSAPLHLPRARDARLLRVTEALRADPADPRPLAAWGRAAGASPRTLARLFLAETGLGFRAWRQRARLLHALVELAARKPVTSVAFEAGYDSPSAFIAAFKREFGTTPARYFRDQADG